MNLAAGEIGSTYEVKALHLDEGIMRRLESLGIFEGTRVEIMNKKAYGAIIIKVRGARWALGRKFAEGIEAEVSTHEKDH